MYYLWPSNHSTNQINLCLYIISDFHIGDETQTEVSAVTPALRQNESHPREKVRSVNTNTAAVKTALGAVLLGGLEWALVWAITEVETYRALGVLIGATVGAAVVGVRHEVLILRIMAIVILFPILLVVFWAIIIIVGLQAAVIMKPIVKTITGKDGMETNLIIAVTMIVLVLGIFSGLLVGIRNGFRQIPLRDVVHFGGGVTAGIAVIAVILADIGVPDYQVVMALVAFVFALLISTIIWAAFFRICALIFAFEFKISINAAMKAAIIILAIMGYCTAVVILIISLCKKFLIQNVHDQTPPFK